MKALLKVSELATELTKQRSIEWFEARKTVKVTGSTIYSAIGCDTLKRQREHFDKVISGVEPAAPSEEQSVAMKHGTDSEIHQIATLTSIIIPFLYPTLTFHEEGFYLKDKYIPQSIFEGKALDAKFGTLYMSWSEESSTVHIVPNNAQLCEDVQRYADELYHGRLPKRPSSISADTKQIKKYIKDFVFQCSYLSEFPSVKGMFGSNNQANDTDKDESPLSNEQVINMLIKAKQTLNESYQLKKQHASQVVVFLLANLDRLWKPEEPHAVPVLFFFRGYSLSMDIARKILEFWKNACEKQGLDVVASSSDGKFLPLMVRGRNGNPLTLHQLSKSVWMEACKLQKSEIVTFAKQMDRKYMFIKIGGIFSVVSSEKEYDIMKTPKYDWSVKTNSKDNNGMMKLNEEEVLSDQDIERDMIQHGDHITVIGEEIVEDIEILPQCRTDLSNILDQDGDLDATIMYESTNFSNAQHKNSEKVSKAFARTN